MKKSKFVFFLVFVAVQIGGGTFIYGQGGSIKFAEVNNIIAFYEWVLEAEFTPEQRQRFQYFLERDFKEHRDTARTNLDTILNTWSQIKQADEDVRRKTRSEFLRGYLQELKKSSDADDVFLLAIYKSAHGGRDTYAELDEARINVADKSDLSVVSGGLPAESLIGRWERYTGSGSITDGTGKTKYGSGKTFSFEFGQGGVVEYTVAEKTLSIMGCKIESTDQARGKFTVNGGSMTISLGAGTSTGTDSCSKAGNYKKAQPAAELTVKFQVKQSDSVFRPDHPTLLCFDGGDGDACFEKVKK